MQTSSSAISSGWVLPGTRNRRRRVCGRRHTADVLAAGRKEPRLPLLLLARGTARGVCAPCLGRTLLYAGTCRNLTDAQRAAKTKTPCWRVAVPDEDVSFTDGLQGAYTQNLARGSGDFIVRRADGVYAYQLAVVTDDAQAGVTQVVRGSDLLSSTPRQIWLQRQLGFPSPATIMCRCWWRRTDGGYRSARRIWTWERCVTGIRPNSFWGCWRMRAGCFLTAKASAQASLRRNFHGRWYKRRTLLSQIRKNTSNRVCKMAGCVL